ncbi:MAG: hypothetical protein PVJ67_00890 [Candidatus Pacearchaeota archaeon]|jgi:hypothetical protein
MTASEITGNSIMAWYNQIYEEIVEANGEDQEIKDFVRSLGADATKLIILKYAHSTDPQAFSRFIMAAAYNKGIAKGETKDSYFKRSADRFIADADLILSNLEKQSIKISDEGGQKK